MSHTHICTSYIYQQDPFAGETKSLVKWSSKGRSSSWRMHLHRLEGGFPSAIFERSLSSLSMDILKICVNPGMDRTLESG